MQNFGRTPGHGPGGPGCASTPNYIVNILIALFPSFSSSSFIPSQSLKPFKIIDGATTWLG